MKYAIITDDLKNKKMMDVVYTFVQRICEKGDIVYLLHPKYRATEAISIGITIDKPVEFDEYNQNNFDEVLYYEIAYDAKPADAFLFAMANLECKYFIFGPNNTTHEGYANLVSSTVSLLRFAAHFKLTAFSISLGEDFTIDKPEEFVPMLNYMKLHTNKGYFAYNIYKIGEFSDTHINRNFHDHFEKVQMKGRDTSNKYWITYVKTPPGEEGDEYCKRLKINYCVRIL